MPLQLRWLPDKGHETLGRVFKDLPCHGVDLVEDARRFVKLLDEPGQGRAVDLGEAEDGEEVNVLDLQARVSMSAVESTEASVNTHQLGGDPLARIVHVDEHCGWCIGGF